MSDASGVTTDYVYDASGSVVAEWSGSAWSKGYVYSGAGQLVAQYNGAISTTGATTIFVHKDHLGSTRVLTTYSTTAAQNAQVSDNLDYLPFGELLSGDSSTTHKFTGKERDSESGLDNFTARYDSSSFGRFMSADPDNAGAIDGDPQSWKGYAYARNNPLLYTDPNGESYTLCSTGDSNGTGKRQCVSGISDEDFEKARKDPGAGYSLQGTREAGIIYYTDQNGNKVAGGTYEQNDVDISQSAANTLHMAGDIAARNLDAFYKQELLNLGGEVGGRIIGAGINAVRAARLADGAIEAAEAARIAAKAAGTAGRQSIVASSEAAAKQAAQEFLGPGAEQITDRTTGAFSGWKSADGTRVVIETHTDAIGAHMNFINKTTGGNLHVRW